jgi:V/A-type H+-transporting ATPase subunit E
MKTLETGQDKIKKISDQLRHQTLEPAKEEAHQIIEAAKRRAEEILAEAESQAQQMIKQAKKQIEQERGVFNSSMKQAAKQAVEALRQEIEQRLFNVELKDLTEKQLSNSQLVAQLINGIVNALEKEGIRADLTAVIPRTASVQDVNDLLLANAKERLKDKPLQLGSFLGGAQVRLEDKRMTIDLTDQALKELLANYVRKDFRELIFS